MQQSEKECAHSGNAEQAAKRQKETPQSSEAERRVHERMVAVGYQNSPHLDGISNAAKRGTLAQYEQMMLRMAKRQGFSVPTGWIQDD